MIAVLSYGITQVLIIARLIAAVMIGVWPAMIFLSRQQTASSHLYLMSQAMCP